LKRSCPEILSERNHTRAVWLPAHAWFIACRHNCAATISKLNRHKPGF